MENEQEISIEEYLHMLLITAMKIYDAQLLLLHTTNEESAKKLQDIHAKLDFIGSNPWKISKEGDE